MMKKSYTLEQAQFLKDYYYDKIMGQVLYDSVGMRIYSVEVLKNSKGKYVVECIGEQLNQSNIHSIISLESIVETLKLKNLNDVLNDLK